MAAMTSAWPLERLAHALGSAGITDLGQLKALDVLVTAGLRMGSRATCDEAAAPCFPN
jgi:hypothetical protein